MFTVLVIPDVHQDIEWVRRILKNENTDAFDTILFLGDFFDTRFPEKVASAGDTAKYMMYLSETYKERFITLLSNHDMPYYYLYPLAKKELRGMDNRNLFPCSGFRSQACYDIAEGLTPEFIKSTKLAAMIDGVLYSHAGILSQLVPYTPDGYDIKRFLNQVDEANENWNTVGFDHPFFACGHVRGGWSDYGGLTWCDFNMEFRAAEGMPPQIFGHTKGDEPRQKGQNWCLDCKQTYYAVVSDGKPIFKLI